MSKWYSPDEHMPAMQELIYFEHPELNSDSETAFMVALRSRPLLIAISDSKKLEKNLVNNIFIASLETSIRKNGELEESFYVEYEDCYLKPDDVYAWIYLERLDVELGGPEDGDN